MIKKDKILKVILLFGDFVLMYVSLYLTLILRNKGFGFDFLIFVDSFTILYVLWLPFIYALDFYEISYFKKISFIYHLSIFCFISLFLGIGYFYLRPQIIFTPKTILIINILIFVILLYLWRKVFYKVITKNTKDKIIIFGFPKNIDKIYNQIKESNFEILAFFVPDSLIRESLSENKFTKIIVTEKELRDLVKKENINLIVFSSDFYSNYPIVVFANIKYLNYNDFYETLAKKVCLDNFSEVLFLEKLSQNNNKIYFILKRILDLLLGLVFLLATVILFPIIFLAVKIDSSGSIFYKQKRVGVGKKIFEVCKFRTMVETKEQNKVWRANQLNQITKVGNFLRRFHLDELPQCLSILKGDIGFVGPRPEWVEIDKIYQKEIPFYNYRYLERPGFTGWAQINYKPSGSVKEAKEKFEYDLYYMKNKSIILDIEIVLKTLRLLIRKHL